MSPCYSAYVHGGRLGMEIANDTRAMTQLVGRVHPANAGIGAIVTTVMYLLRGCRFVTAGAAVEAVGQRGLTSKTQIEVIVRCFNWLVWLLAALNMLEETEVKLPMTAFADHRCFGWVLP